MKYVMVTREFQPTGFKLRSLAQEYGYQNLVIYERGLGFKELLGVYMMSDLFFIPSLAEGLCMPCLGSSGYRITCTWNRLHSTPRITG